MKTTSPKLLCPVICLSCSSEVLRVSLSAMCGAVNGVREEIKSICHCYSWMQEVWQFMHQWEGWDRMAALSAEEFEACPMISLIYEPYSAFMYHCVCMYMYIYLVSGRSRACRSV